MAKHCISVDWLTMYCECHFLNTSTMYRFEKCLTGNAIFKEIYNVYDLLSGEKYAIIQRVPYSPIIPKAATMVQLCNRQLYKKDWLEHFNHFCNVSHIIMKSISRIDICADFNFFANGLKPHNLIAGFHTGKYIKMGSQKGSSNFDFDSEQRYDYIRFGTREAQVSAYLYNKTKELREVKDKPYIREMWEKSGLDTEIDVWRLEFSMRTDQLRIIEKQTGEVLRMDLSYLRTVGIIENIFDACMEKYMDVRINDGQVKKCRMKKVTLLTGVSSTVLLSCPTNKACTDRVDRIVAKRLANAYSHWRVDTEEEHEIIMRALSIILTQTSLWQWYRAKIAPDRGWFKE